MKFSPLNFSSGDSKVFQFGIRIDKEHREALREQFFLAHRLYNDIVAEIRAVGQAAIDFLESQNPDAAMVRGKLIALGESLKAARADDDRPLYESLSKDYQSVWNEWYQHLHSARKEHNASLKEQFLNQLLFRKECRITVLRREATAAGLSADTASSILTAALQAFGKTWPRFELPRFKRFADDPLKTLVIQFKKPITITDIFNGDVSELKILAERIGKCSHIVKQSATKYSTVQIRIGAYDKRVVVQGSVYLHRPIPPDAKISYATIVERRIGKDLRHYLQLSATGLPVEAPNGNSGIVAMHTGWTRDELGIQIAGIAAAGEDEPQVIYLDKKVEGMLEKEERLKSVRDKLRDEIVSHIKAVTVNDAPEDLADELLTIRKLPTQHVTQKRLAAVVWHWKNTCPDYAPALLERQDKWRKADKMLLQTSSHAGYRARNARKKQYESIAAKVTGDYGTIVLSKPDLKAAARIKKERTGEHTKFKPDARKNRTRAALSELHEKMLMSAAQKKRVVVGAVGERANVCAACGGEVAYNEEMERFDCASCRQVVEPLLNTAKYIAQQSVALRDDILKVHAESVATLESKLEKRSVRKEKRMEGRKKKAAAERKEKSGASASASE